MPKTAIILSGVSGVGKTHARLNDPELKDLPHIDIADVYRKFPEFNWYEALYALLKRVREAFEGHNQVVIEGYFLPGSVSRATLQGDLKVIGATPEIRYFWAPFETCRDRIVAQWESGEISDQECKRRIELLKECWRPE